MLVAALDDLARQLALTPNLKTALDFLQRNRRADDLPERLDVDGADVYAMLQIFETQPAAEPVRLEAHRTYIDIQYVVEGEEVMGWARVDELGNPTPYNPEKDVLHGSLPAARLTPVLVKAGQAAVFFPEDAHAPKLCAAQPVRVKKIVLKVRCA